MFSGQLKQESRSFALASNDLSGRGLDFITNANNRQFSIDSNIAIAERFLTFSLSVENEEKHRLFA